MLEHIEVKLGLKREKTLDLEQTTCPVTASHSPRNVVLTTDNVEFNSLAKLRRAFSLA